MKRSITAILIICAMLFSTGCTVNVNINDKSTVTENASGGGRPWINSDIKENITEDMPVDPKDDFHLYANKEWLLENEIPAGYSDWSHYKERDLEVKRQCMELLGDDRLSGHDAGLIQTYNKLVLDWDERNTSGVTEIRELFDRISIYSLLPHLHSS